ncbi:MAG: hypothetical protein QOG35_1854 [Solirubrobacteraceae bacterium]|jgi:hypothetical protein|nr:hypothetical protein [Solirubrobacteraceae bacterium]
MRSLRSRRIGAIATGGLILLAIVGWIAARQIRSPAQVAADTAAPAPSPITVPVVRRTLSTVVIVRGTVRYSAPRPTVLATSKVKQGSDIVTRAPRRRAELSAGALAMAVDGRPVFVLPGAIPMSRDLHRGLQGPDVMQLERALSQLGFDPGAVDGRFDARTESAVGAFYLRHGWEPFGPTDVQLEQLRTAESAAAQARDAHLQALSAIAQARTATPAEVEQARADVVTAKDAVDTALLGVVSAQAKLETAQTLASNAQAGVGVAQANGRRDEAAADADVAIKRAAVNSALDDQRVAQLKLLEVPLDAPPSDRETAAAAVRQAAEAIPRAQSELDASIAAAAAARADGPDAQRRAQGDSVQAAGDLAIAGAELRRARTEVRTMRSAARLAVQRVRVLSAPFDTRAMQAIAGAAASEERRTRAEADRQGTESKVQVPANEIVFFPNLPLRVDTVKVTRGSAVSGSVMDVTSSHLVVDSSLSVSDSKLVRPGDPVTIEDQDLGITQHGAVSEVADTPGTNRVDPSRFSFAVRPSTDAAALLGASVKLTIAVKSTSGAVLAVPASALSIGGDGSSRVQVRRGGRSVIVRVVPGLAAEGLVEIRPAAGERLERGDLVIVGAR